MGRIYLDQFKLTYFGIAPKNVEYQHVDSLLTSVRSLIDGAQKIIGQIAEEVKAFDYDTVLRAMSGEPGGTQPAQCRIPASHRIHRGNVG